MTRLSVLHQCPLRTHGTLSAPIAPCDNADIDGEDDDGDVSDDRANNLIMVMIVTIMMIS